MKKQRPHMTREQADILNEIGFGIDENKHNYLYATVVSSILWAMRAAIEMPEEVKDVFFNDDWTPSEDSGEEIVSILVDLTNRAISIKAKNESGE